MKVYATIQLQGVTEEAQLGDLRRIAGILGVEVRSDEDGTLTAERQFGQVIVRAQRAKADWRPLETARELCIGLRDKAEGRHWAWTGDCWCGEVHYTQQKGLALIAPPWDRSRDGEFAW